MNECLQPKVVFQLTKMYFWTLQKG